MFRLMIAFVLALMVAPLVHAQRPLPPPDRDWNDIPRWCRGYSQHDYWRELRACERDWDCRRRVQRKAERCGLSGRG